MGILFNIFITIVTILATMWITGMSFKFLLLIPIGLIYFLGVLGLPAILIIYLMITSFK